ncbi:hypothetical protein D0869_04649 [Hortaea werneckii]|uniref:NACHT-NTPase and P-loop NTPases N-terminal domain-containing protein n=1 Tax=Hortaea werneckii TaxID=91943 RepID=A0A3M6X144_HORWE|nr:hypothetical protein D0869_04649 [Hortaea werneckii]
MKLKRFCGEVKGVPRKLHRLTDELEVMTEALSTFTVDHEKLLASKNPVRRSLALCEAAVRDLASTIYTIEDRMGRRKRITSVYAALRREEIDELVETMERTRNLLDFVSRVYLDARRQDELSSLLVHCQTISSAASSSTVGIPMSQTTTQDGSVAQQEIEVIRRSPASTSVALARWRVLECKASCWLFSQIWELSVERASSGWKISLRFQRTLPAEHFASACCVLRIPVVAGIQKLIFDGEVLPDDKIAYPYSNSLSLITISAAWGHLDSVRYLLSQGVDPRTLATEWNSRLSGNLATILVWRDSTLDTIIEHFKFLSGLCVFENRTSHDQHINWLHGTKFCVDCLLQPRASWSMDDNLTFFRSIVLLSPNASAKFLHLVEPALKERAYFALQADTPDLTSLMHLLAECACAISWDDWRTYKHELAAFIASGINTGSCLHVLSRTGSGMTPLMHALLGAMRSFQSYTYERVNFDLTVSAVQYRFQRWPTLLAMAGVDLSRYAKREARLFRKHWRTSQRVLWKSFSRHCEVFALRFGSKATEWGLWVSHPGDSYSGLFWDMVEHPERSIPGAWTELEKFDPEPSVLRCYCSPRGYFEFELQDPDRLRWPDDLDYFED